jgi:hypothetical protein
VISVIGHSFVDYPLREPVLMFLWLTLAGSLTKTTDFAEFNFEIRDGCAKLAEFRR